MSRLDAAKAALSKLDKRTRIMLGAMLLIVIVGGGYFALSSGKSSSSTAFGAIPTHHVNPSSKAKPKATKTPTPVPLPSQSDPERDPFAPLPQEVAATTGSSSSTSTAAATAAPTAAATAAPAAAPTTAPTAAPTAAPTTAPAASHTLELLSITGTTASVTYNGVDKTVKAGDTLSNGVVCIKITDDSIFVSDSSKAYALAPGQTITF